MFKLVIEDDEGNKTVVPVIRDEITIGREDGNTIRLTERNVSRNHARLVRDDGAVFLEEVSARYGTRKNGDRIDGRTDFGPGDVFTIGDYRLTLQSETAPEAKKPKKPNGAPPLPGGEFTSEPTQVTKDDGVARRTEGGTEIIETDPAKLVIVSSNFAGQEFPLSRREMVIGRGEECDIIIDHRSVSQKHAKVVREDDGGYKIVDLKSKNGVKVGGEEYRAVHLKRGDIVELGHVKFRFVESGENYVFTPQMEDEIVAPASSSRSPMLGLLAIIVLVALAVVGYVLVSGGGEETPKAVATNTATQTPPTQTSSAPTPPPEELKNASADEMIAKAEEKYLAGKVFEASGILEAAKVQPDLSPDQVEQIDDLLSKCRREKQFARSFENGKDHFNNQRWMEAVRDFHAIPPDPPSNIYKLMTDDQLKQKSIERVLENAVLDAKDAREAEDIEAALAGPQELSQMYPDDKEIAAVVEQINEEGKRFERRPVAAVNRPKPKNNNRPKKPSFTKDPTLIEPLQKEALQATMGGNNSEAISKAKEAIRHGCGAPCFRILGTAYKKAGNTSEACKWYKKAGANSGLDCP